MAGTSLREGSPRGRAAAGTVGAADLFPAIVVLLALGLLLRVIIAYVLVPGSGFPNDLAAFQAWGNDLAQHGPVGFYDRQSFIDYPPVYILLLGAISFVLGGNMGEVGVKLIPIFADLGLAYIVLAMVLELGGSPKRGVIAALVILLNPITWFNSAIWGQADAIGSIFLLLGLRELLKDRRETAAALAVVSVLTKIQLGILGILVGFVILRRSIIPDDEDRFDPLRLLTSIGAGLLTAGVILLPFSGLDFGGYATRLGTFAGALTFIVGILAAAGIAALIWRYAPIQNVYRGAAAAAGGVLAVVVAGAMNVEGVASHVLGAFGEYPYLTLNAYNPWALMRTAEGQAMAIDHAWVQDSAWVDARSGASGDGYLIGPFSAFWTVALAVLALLLVVGAILAWREAARRSNVARAEAGTEAADEPADEPAAERAAARPSGGPAALRGRLAQWANHHDWVEELRSGAVVAVAAAVLLGILVVIQPIGSIPASYFGDGLLILVLLGAAVWGAWRDDALSLLVALSIMAIAFFVVPTRVHERYLFPFFGVGAVLLALSWRWRIVYVLLAVVNSANLLAVLVQYKGIPETDGSIANLLIDWGRFLFDAKWSDMVWPIAVSGILTGLVMIWALIQMRGMASRSLALEAAGAADDTSWGWLLAAPEEGEPEPRPTSGGAASADSAGSAAQPATTPEGELVAEASDDYDYDYEYDSDEEPERERPTYVPASVMRIWRRFSGPSSYPDRSKSLEREPRGRIDKLDLWIVAALVVGVLSMRVYRLGEPRQMYFDEVYHARTATEFLQDWQYGIPHDIYEWTHPMLAKYAIAGGIVNFDDYKVTSSGQLTGANGQPISVKAAFVQPRMLTSPLAQQSTNSAFSNTDNRFGDRLFLATGSSVLVYDLESRKLVHTFAIAGASAFASPDESGGVLYVGTSQGRIWRIDLNNLDAARLGFDVIAAPVQLSVDTGIAITKLYAGTPPFILATDGSGNVVSIDLTKDGGTLAGKATIPGAADFADLGAGGRTIDVTGSKVTDPAALASSLADITGLDASALESAIRSANPNFPVALPVGSLASAQYDAVQAAIQAGTLPGITITASNPTVLVAYQAGLGVLDVRHLQITSTDQSGNPGPVVATDAPATSIMVKPSTRDPLNCTSGHGCDYSYVAAGNSIRSFYWSTNQDVITVQDVGDRALSRFPGLVTQVFWNDATHVSQALGKTPDGSSWTIYAIEANSDSVFANANLPFEPVAVGLDSTSDLPNTDREALLAFSSTGQMASVDIGQFAFSWRIVGVFFGAIMAACLYLLVRILFRRRTVGLIVAFATLFDGMLFAQSRIAMNDTYVGAFLLLSYLLFALLWLGVWKRRAAFWLVMPMLGVVLGLALASKWVAFYAMASMGILFLIRSALGRLVTILGLAAGTGMLGYQAIAEMTTQPNTGDWNVVMLLIAVTILTVVGGTIWTMRQRTTPDRVFTGGVTAVIAALLLGAALTFTPGTIENGAPNYTFFLIMLVLTTLAAAGNAYRPVAWTREEFWFSTLGVGIAGVFIAVLGFLFQHGFASNVLSGFVSSHGERMVLIGAALVGVGIAAAVAWDYIGAFGFGPRANARWKDWEFWGLTVGVGLAGLVVVLVGLAAEARLLPDGLQSRIPVRGLYIAAAGAAVVAVDLALARVFYVGAASGYGPLAETPGQRDIARFAEPPSPAPEGWLRLGSGFGLPALWTTFCIMVLPFVIYIFMYFPWAMPWQQQTSDTGPLPAIACWHTNVDLATGAATCTDGYPAGHTGQTLWDLTLQMYNYHNNLRASHAASSPWWAWPMDLKPVWFESIGYENNTQGSMIYDGGNPVLWWLGIGAMAFVIWQAYKRRSLGLALIVIAFFWQWLSWSRIDRAAFQYHFYTALPFFLAGLAYFLAELWHGPSRRTWMLARVLGIGVCLFPGAMWLLKPELCGLARVNPGDYYGGTVCGSGTGNVVIETRLFLIGVVLVIALVVLAAILWRLERRQSEGYEDANWMWQLIVPVLAAGALLWAIGQAGPRTTLFSAALPSDYLAILFVGVGVLLAIVAALTNNPRRFVLGVGVAAVIVFVALYPNLSAMPMPQAITGIYNSILPTWLYGFQFSVNLQESRGVQLVSPSTMTLALFTLVLAGIAGWAAWEHRLVVGYRRARAAGLIGPGGLVVEGDGADAGDSSEAND